MIHHITPLDEAELKHEMRSMYKEIGFYGSLQALYEIVKAGEILTEVMIEERKKERDTL